MIPLWTAVVSGSLLLAIWLGYPAVTWLRGRRHSAPMHPDSAGGATRHATVVLATRATPEAVAERVRNLLGSSHAAALLDIVVAWDGDRAASVVEALQQGLDAEFPASRVLVVLSDLPGGKAAALNAGVRAARGDRLVFADTAQRFDHETIPALLAALEDERFGAISGVLQLPDDASPLRAYWALERFLRRHEARVHSSVGVTGAVYAMPRALWTPLPEGTLLDDVWVPMRLVMRGRRIGVATAARAWDVREFAAKDEVARKTRTQTGVLQLLHLMPELLTADNPVRWSFVWHKLARLLTPLLAGLLGVALVMTLWPLVARDWHVWRYGLAVTLGVIILVPTVRRPVVALCTYTVAMQWALLRAIAMAWSGRWSVWRPTDR